MWLMDEKRENFICEFLEWRHVAAVFRFRMCSRCTRRFHGKFLVWLNLMGCLPNIVELVPQSRGQFWPQRSAAGPVGWSVSQLSLENTCVWDWAARAACPCPEVFSRRILEDLIGGPKRLCKVRSLVFTWWCVLFIYSIVFSQMMVLMSYRCVLPEHWHIGLGVISRQLFAESLHYLFTITGELLLYKKVINWLGTDVLLKGMRLYGLGMPPVITYFLTDDCMVAEQYEVPPCTVPCFSFVLFLLCLFVVVPLVSPFFLLSSFCIVFSFCLLLHACAFWYFIFQLLF